jgi:hypothetical protein
MDPNTSEPQFTNCTRDFLGTLDYIFYTGETVLSLSDCCSRMHSYIKENILILIADLRDFLCSEVICPARTMLCDCGRKGVVSESNGRIHGSTLYSGLV